MSYIRETDRSQTLLLPDAVDDFVLADNPVRFIDAFVDELDLKQLGFVRARTKSTGRTGYDPADLLRLYIYGYLIRVRSSRRLEAECHRNIEVMSLMRRLQPDFKTIANFWRETVEHPFGTIKHWMQQGTFLMRRPENVRGEFSATALAYNIRRALNLIGLKRLIDAAKAQLLAKYG